MHGIMTHLGEGRVTPAHGSLGIGDQNGKIGMLGPVLEKAAGKLLQNIVHEATDPAAGLGKGE